MQTPRSPIQPPTQGNQITVLSIDGGGIRGIIPGTILAFLESELQVEKKTGSFSTYTNKGGALYKAQVGCSPGNK